MNSINKLGSFIYLAAFLGLCWAVWTNRDKLPWYLKYTVLLAFLIVGMVVEGLRIVFTHAFIEPFRRQRPATRTTPHREEPPREEHRQERAEKPATTSSEPTTPQPERVDPARVAPDNLTPTPRAPWDDPSRLN